MTGALEPLYGCLLLPTPTSNLVPRVYSAFKMAAAMVRRHLESGVDPGNEVDQQVTPTR